MKIMKKQKAENDEFCIKNDELCIKSDEFESKLSTPAPPAQAGQ